MIYKVTQALLYLQVILFMKKSDRLLRGIIEWPASQKIFRASTVLIKRRSTFHVNDILTFREISNIKRFRAGRMVSRKNLDH